MAGHSKWAQIKHKKAKEDAKRGRMFTKLVKEITVAARAGGPDPAGNPRLRSLIEEAKSINMPIQNVTRAIKKGTGELPGVTYERAMYEGYGPSGIAILIEVLTDNKNRAVAALRHLFSKQGGNLAESGAVSWMFEQKGLITAPSNNMTEDELLEKLIDYDVENIYLEEDLFCIHSTLQSLDQVKQAVINAGLSVESAKLEWTPKIPISLPDNEAKKAYEFLNSIEDLDDVQNVYTNLA